MEIPSTQSFSKSMTGHPHTRETPFTRAAKRSLDVVLSSLGMFFFSPFLFWIAWRIRRDSPGPVFYRGLAPGTKRETFLYPEVPHDVRNAESYAGPRVTARMIHACNALWALAARNQAERAAPVLERAQRRDEPGGASPGRSLPWGSSGRRTSRLRCSRCDRALPARLR